MRDCAFSNASLRLYTHSPSTLPTPAVVPTSLDESKPPQQEKQKMRLRINDSQILWPGKVRKKPEGIMIPTHLKVLTVEEKPFVYVRKLADDVTARCDDDEIPCPLFNATDGLGNILSHYIMRSLSHRILYVVRD